MTDEKLILAMLDAYIGGGKRTRFDRMAAALGVCRAHGGTVPAPATPEPGRPTGWDLMTGRRAAAPAAPEPLPASPKCPKDECDGTGWRAPFGKPIHSNCGCGRPAEPVSEPVREHVCKCKNEPCPVCGGGPSGEWSEGGEVTCDDCGAALMVAGVETCKGRSWFEMADIVCPACKGTCTATGVDDADAPNCPRCDGEGQVEPTVAEARTEYGVEPSVPSEPPAVSEPAPAPPGLTFEAFGRANRERCEATSGYHTGVKEYGAATWMLCLAEEVGEVAGAVLGATGQKKRKAHLTAKDVGDELADLVAYADLLTGAFGLDLGACVAAKWNKVSERIGYSGRLAAPPLPGAPPFPPRAGDVWRTVRPNRQDEWTFTGETDDGGRWLAHPKSVPAIPGSFPEVCFKNGTLEFVRGREPQ